MIVVAQALAVCRRRSALRRLAREASDLNSRSSQDHHLSTVSRHQQDSVDRYSHSRRGDGQLFTTHKNDVGSSRFTVPRSPRRRPSTTLDKIDIACYPSRTAFDRRSNEIIDSPRSRRLPRLANGRTTASSTCCVGSVGESADASTTRRSCAEEQRTTLGNRFSRRGIFQYRLLSSSFLGVVFRVSTSL